MQIVQGGVEAKCHDESRYRNKTDVLTSLGTDLSPLKHDQHTGPSLHCCRRNLVGGQHEAIRAFVPQLVCVTVCRVARGIDVVNAGPGGGVQGTARLSDGVRGSGDSRDSSPGGGS